MTRRTFWIAASLALAGACERGTVGDAPASASSGGADQASTTTGATITSSAASSSGSGGHGGSGPVITPWPYDWLGVVGTGQSLSVGAAGTPVVSTTQPYHNLQLFDAAPDPKYDGQGDMLSVIPLVSPIRPQFPGYPAVAYPNNIYGETPNEGMANQLSASTLALGGFDTVSVQSNVGESGQSITVIQKNGTGNAYASTLYEATALSALAAQQNKTYGVGAVLLTHGETDAADPNYEAEITKLLDDYNADIKAITKQPEDIVMLLSQQGTFPADPGSYGLSTVAEWKLGVDLPGKIYCAGPKYQYDYAGDHIHMPAGQYRRLGEKYAEVFAHAVLMKEPWAPLQPTSVKLSGAVITVDFHVPDPPLVWEESISPPHQVVLTQWAVGRGFEVGDSTGPLTITSVAIQGSSVVVTLDKPPTGQKLQVAYALVQDQAGYSGGTDNGRRGQLRDSDAFIGYDAESIACNVQQGSATVTAAAPGAFAGRSRTDIAAGAGLVADTVVSALAGDTMTLSQPWTGASGAVMVSFHDDQRNYAVQFLLDVP